MENLFVELAWKSIVTSGGAILLLHLLRHRTAAERSLVGHAGLVATLLLPVAVVFLPAWSVQAPAVLPSALTVLPSVGEIAAVSSATIPAAPGVDKVGLLSWAYLLPSAALLLTTLAAIARLFILRARASVLVDMPWLSALAHAQRRMGFKHGTALLVSDDIVSPVSWGVMRPVILLDSRALAATDEAEAIIAHELAHVARLDWAKLLLARLATALFWFNPFVWKLAAECHQLREEAADDSVLHSQVDGPGYASLLVGAARHENKALLLAAHGVAPGKSSLSRRVARVLDQGLSRAPARGTWVLISSVAAIILSAPLAALTPVAPGLDIAEAGPVSLAASVGVLPAKIMPQPVAARPAAPAPAAVAIATRPVPTAASMRADPSGGASFSTSPQVKMVTPAPRGAAASIPPATPATPPPPPPRSLASVAASVSVAAQAAAVAVAGIGPSVDALISRKIHGVTPEYVAGITASNPGLRGLTEKELVSFRIHGVTPDFVRGFSDAGFTNLSSKELLDARVLGVGPSYARDLAALGYRGLTMRELTKLRTRGVTPAYIRELRRAGLSGLSVAELIRMRIFGVNGTDFGATGGVGRPRGVEPDPDG